MIMRSLGVATTLLILLSGCAAGRRPDGAGEVTGHLASIELHTKLPVRGEELYPTVSRDRFYASDRNVHVLSYWSLPNPGDYTSKVTLRTPTGAVHQEREGRFQAKGTSRLTAERFGLPQGEAATSLAGIWQVEVALDGTPVGRRIFTFDPSSIRLRTDARLLISPGRSDQRVAWIDWRWSQEYGALEHVKATLAILGVVLRDELARRFPNVEGPRERPEARDAMLILVPNLEISPNAAIGASLELDVLTPPSTLPRKFVFRTTAGYDRLGGGGSVFFSVAAADLAIQAGSSPELLEFLIAATQAVSEASQPATGDSLTSYNRGRAYHAKGDLDRAIADFTEAIRLDPNYASAYNGRGNAYYDTGDLDKAFADYSEAIRLDPKLALAYRNRGRVHLFSGSLARAQSDFRQASELEPGNAYAALWLDIAQRRGNLPSRLAQAAWRLDMQVWPAPVVRLYLGETTPAAVLAAADDPDPKKKREQACEANFYSGELALLQDAKAEATRLFRLAVSACPRTFVEWSAANAELKALGVSP